MCIYPLSAPVPEVGLRAPESPNPNWDLHCSFSQSWNGTIQAGSLLPTSDSSSKEWLSEAISYDKFQMNTTCPEPNFPWLARSFKWDHILLISCQLLLPWVVVPASCFHFLLLSFGCHRNRTDYFLCYCFLKAYLGCGKRDASDKGCHFPAFERSCFDRRGNLSETQRSGGDKMSLASREHAHVVPSHLSGKIFNCF